MREKKGEKINKFKEANRKNMVYALQRTAGVPMSLDRLLKARAEMIAPALPAAADMPCAEARKRVGKTSAG